MQAQAMLVVQLGKYAQTGRLGIYQLFHLFTQPASQV